MTKYQVIKEIEISTANNLLEALKEAKRLNKDNLNQKERYSVRTTN